MSDGMGKELVRAVDVARGLSLRHAPNGVAFGIYGDSGLSDQDLERLVQAVPAGVAKALELKEYFFVPLAIGAGRRGDSETMIAPTYTVELADDAICHRNVKLGPATDGIFLSTRLLGDKFAIAFELFINVGHAFVEVAGVPVVFADLCWSQALAEVKGETSQDSWESRTQALSQKGTIDEKARAEYIEAAFADALAIYLLSLTIDFDYSELREREYPLLAPPALAERLKLVAKLFPPNTGYEFAIKYRRRA